MFKINNELRYIEWLKYKSDHIEMAGGREMTKVETSKRDFCNTNVSSYKR